jgi:hypothetical protein
MLADYWPQTIIEIMQIDKQATNLFASEVECVTLSAMSKRAMAWENILEIGNDQ